MKIKIPILAALLAFSCRLMAQTSSGGSVAGTIVDEASDRPVADVVVAIHDAVDRQTVRSTTTDHAGAFRAAEIPLGEYVLVYGVAGGASQESPAFKIDAGHRAVQLGRLLLPAEAAIALAEMEVTARREVLYNSIDRKVYNVGQDLQSATGSAGDLLQNVPSVQVDVEGNVSLRGDSNVTILVNGKPSSLMARNRAAALEQMSADRIERVEVITNPSARYKPDGTAGIINLVLKRQQDAGSSATMRASVGNEGRYNGSVSANSSSGRFNVFGTASVRQESRERHVEENRTRLDGANNPVVFTAQRTVDRSRPLSFIAEAGVDFKPDDDTEWGASISFNSRELTRKFSQLNVSRDATGAVTSEYERLGTGPETEDETEFTVHYQRSATNDRELNIELQHGREIEREDIRYANVFRTPVRDDALDRTETDAVAADTELTVEYVLPLADDAKIETGYSGEREKIDVDFRASSFDPATGSWVADETTTNRFIADSTIHAFYATYGRPMGRFGILGGVRFEQARVKTNQVTARLSDENDYARLYPSLHLSYDLTDLHQLHLNYSHRVNRPDGDDLNPYPEFQDPFNLRAGNPHLVPEDIHSLEGGYEFHQGDITYLATAYYRFRYHGITDVTRFIDSTTLLTTKENLATSRASGLELGATTRLRESLSLNFSANLYRNEIDARNLGFTGRRSAVAWDAKLNTNWEVSKSLLLQLNTSYTAQRLTPQGERRPTSVTNLGFRYNFKDNKTALVLAVSDVFNSMRDQTVIDTPTLRSDVVRRRSSRVIYVGFIYKFGKVSKAQDEDLSFEESL